MEREELLNVVDSILELNEQGDRSVELDKVRGGINAIYESLNSTSEENEALRVKNSKLEETNGVLYTRASIVEKAEEKPEVDLSLDESIEGLFN